MVRRIITIGLGIALIGLIWQLLDEEATAYETLMATDEATENEDAGDGVGDGDDSEVDEAVSRLRDEEEDTTVDNADESSRLSL